MQNSPYQKEMAELFSQATSYVEETILEKYEQAKKDRKTRSDQIFEKFIVYVEQYCSEQRSVKFYADKLFITTQHLSKTVKDASGKSVKDWISEFVLMEAKLLLKSTHLTIQEVSNKMNFPDQSFFGKYFKKYMGLSPKKYVKLMTDQQ
jgi:YesN/AraC family two-component response regulator